MTRGPRAGGRPSAIGRSQRDGCLSEHARRFTNNCRAKVLANTARERAKFSGRADLLGRDRCEGLRGHARRARRPFSSDVPHRQEQPAPPYGPYYVPHGRPPRGSTRGPGGAGGPSGPWGSTHTCSAAASSLGREWTSCPSWMPHPHAPAPSRVPGEGSCACVLRGPGGVLATKVGYFGVKSTNVIRDQMGTLPAKPLRRLTGTRPLTAVSGIGRPPSRVPMRRPSTGGCAERARSTSLPHEDHTSTRVEGVGARQNHLVRGTRRESQWVYFSHARMARSALPPPAAHLKKNYTKCVPSHLILYIRRIADPKNRSRLTRHDFAYAISPRVHQRAPRKVRLPSTPHF